MQDYENICLIIHFDTQISFDYISKYEKQILKKFPESKLCFTNRVKRDPTIMKLIGGNVCYHAPYNQYFNKMYDKCTDENGFIMYMDDDDCFTEKTSVSEIMKACESQDKLTEHLVLWRVDVAGRIIPSDKNKNSIVPGDRGGACAFPVTQKNNAIWLPYSFGDYRIITNLAKTCKVVYLDKVLSMTQNRESTGNFGRAIDKKN